LELLFLIMAVPGLDPGINTAIAAFPKKMPASSAGTMSIGGFG
jgi:hypothetical protein